MSATRQILRAAERLVWFSFLAFLLVISFTSAAYQTDVWMRLSLGLYVLAAIYLLLILLGLPYNHRALRRGRSVIWLMAAALAWLFLQTVMPFAHGLLESMAAAEDKPGWFNPLRVVSIDPQRTKWLMFANLTAVAVMLLGMSLIRTRNRLKQILYLFIFVGFVHAMSGIAAKYGGVYLVDRQQLDGHWSAARGWFVNRNHYAAFLVMSLAGAIAFLLRARHTWVLLSVRSVAFAAALLSIFAVILSQSRSGMVSLLAILIMVLFLLPLLKGKTDMVFRTNAKTGLQYSMAAVLLLLFITAMFGQELLQRLATSFIGLGERELQWAVTLQAIGESPWVGFGGGSYAAVFQYFRDDAELRQVVFDQAHNDYLHIWLEQGLVGLGLWIATLVAVFLLAYRGYRVSHSSLVAASLAASAFVLMAALLQAMVDFNLQIVSLRCYFFAIIAVVLAAPTAHSNSHRFNLERSTENDG